MSLKTQEAVLEEPPTKKRTMQPPQDPAEAIGQHWRRYDAGGSGDCFFRAVAAAREAARQTQVKSPLSQDEARNKGAWIRSQAVRIRSQAVKHLEKHRSRFRESWAPASDLGTCFEQWLENIAQQSHWASDYLIQATCEKLGCPIVVWKKQGQEWKRFCFAARYQRGVALCTDLSALGRWLNNKQEAPCVGIEDPSGNTLESVTQVAAAIWNFWNSFWVDRERNLPPLWDREAALLEPFPQIGNEQWEPPTASDLHGKARRATGSAGPDGWSAAQIRDFPRAVLVALEALGRQWLAQGQVPRQLTQANRFWLVPVAKTRPICILSVWWRLWNSAMLHSADLQGWILRNLPEELASARGRSTADVFLQLSVKLPFPSYTEAVRTFAMSRANYGWWERSPTEQVCKTLWTATRRGLGRLRYSSPFAAAAVFGGNSHLDITWATRLVGALHAFRSRNPGTGDWLARPLSTWMEKRGWTRTRDWTWSHADTQQELSLRPRNIKAELQHKLREAWRAYSRRPDMRALRCVYLASWSSKFNGVQSGDGLSRLLRRGPLRHAACLVLPPG